MIGKELYEIYNGYCKMLGLEGDPWAELSRDEQRAWERTAEWAEAQHDT